MGARQVRSGTPLGAADGLSAEVTVGLADERELAVVGALVVDTYVAQGYVASDSPYLAQLRDVETRWREADVLVARATGQGVVATVTFCLGGSRWANIARPGEAEFRMLAVRPDQQGHGLGRLLVRACLDRAAAAGATSTVISTEPEMVVAQRMYERLGFVRTPERDWAPRPGIDLITYRYDAQRMGRPPT